MKNRFDEMDNLRGIAMIMVIISHSVIVHPINLGDSYQYYLIREITRYISMPIFFMVSGFCFSYHDQYGHYIIKKIHRVLIPHFVFGLIELLPRIIANPLVNQQMDTKEAIIDFVFYGGSDWFLTTLFVVFLVFPAFHILYQSGKVGRVISVIVVLLLYLFQDEFTNIFQFRMAILNLLYYMIGYVVRQQYENEKFITQLQSHISAILGGGVMIIMLVIMENTVEPRIIESIGAIGGGVAVYFVATRMKGKIQNVLKEIGKYSLQIYLLNGYVLVAMRTFMVSILGITQPLVIIVGNVIVILSVTYIISRYVLNRFKWTRVISGL